MKKEESRFRYNIDFLIRRSELPLKSIASALSIPSTTLQNWRTGETKPGLGQKKRLYALAKYFNVPVEKLLFQDCTTIKKKQLKRITEKLKTEYGKQLELSFSTGKNSLERNVEFRKEA